MGNEKSKEQYNLVKRYSVHVRQSKTRKTVLFDDDSWVDKHAVLFADFRLWNTGTGFAQ